MQISKFVSRFSKVIAIVGTVVAMSAPIAASAQTVTPYTTDAQCRRQQFSYGSSGSCVKEIQHLFNYDKDDYGECGMSQNYGDVSEDGSFGYKTRSAVEYLQRACHITANGIVGPQTWSHLIAYN